MTTYSTDFSSYTVGSAPTGWTSRWTTANSTWAIRSKAGSLSGKTLEHTGTAAGSHLLTLDSIDADANRANTEILARFRTTDVTTTKTIRLFLRASGAAGAEAGYFIDLPSSAGSSVALSMYLAGTTYTATTAAFTFVANTWYYVRLRMNGVNASIRVWDASVAEPGTWLTTATDGSITTAGWVGVGGLNYQGTKDFDWFSVGTNGDTAPSPIIAPQQPWVCVFT